MKLPMIIVQDKRTGRKTVLSDSMPILNAIKEKDSIIIEDIQYNRKSDYSLAPEGIRYMTIPQILEEYMHQEVTWLRDRKLIEQCEKCIELFNKIEAKVNDQAFEQMQQQLEFGMKSIEMEIEVDDNADLLFPEFPGTKITKDEWDHICKISYQSALAAVRATKPFEAVREELKKEGFIMSDYFNIAEIYYNFCLGLFPKEEGMEKITRIREKIVKE